MFRSLVFLVGAAVLGAFMAAVYYAPDNIEHREQASTRSLAAGDVQQDGLQPSLEGSDIVYHIEVLEGKIDVYVMDKEWATGLVVGGDLHLQQPFGYYKSLSAQNVTGQYTFTIKSDGETWYSVVFDNSDSFYRGDAGENEAVETARLHTTVRFIDEEARSLTFGYFAVLPSVILVAVTFGRQANRWRLRRKGS